MGQVLHFPSARTLTQTFGAYEQLTPTRVRLFLFGRFTDLDFQLKPEPDPFWPYQRPQLVAQIDHHWALDDGSIPTEHHYIELASLLLQFAASFNAELSIVRI